MLPFERPGVEVKRLGIAVQDLPPAASYSAVLTQLGGQLERSGVPPFALMLMAAFVLLSPDRRR